MTYDHIIVGGGTAGCVLAARLSEDPAIRVLLLEAGPRSRAKEMRMPAAWPDLFRGKLDWGYETPPEPGLDDRRIILPRGRMLGGSSAMNAQMWVPGRAEDYDAWEAAGARGWNWEAIEPALERARSVMQPVPHRDPNPLSGAFLEAAEALGLRRLDGLDHPDLEGAGMTHLIHRRGMRCHVADRYLEPVRRRANLEVRTGCQVRRVVIDQGRATGVLVDVGGGAAAELHARNVHLTAGAFGSPHLLMLSGVGPAEHLRAYGIEVRRDVPDVGQHLQDHVVTPLQLTSRGVRTVAAAKAPAELLRYLVHRKGLLSSNVAEAAAFVRSRPDLALPDLELIFAAGLLLDQGLTFPDRHGFGIGVIPLQPRSRGQVSLSSPDPRHAPSIRMNAYTDPGGEDLAVALAGLRVARRMLASPSLAVFADEELDLRGAQGDRELEAFVRAVSHTLYHPVATCRMGPEGRGVVDERLRVHGIEGLRVVDASVMPALVRGHPMAATLAVAERAARLIAQDAKAGSRAPALVV